jgi:hypothetical protein
MVSTFAMPVATPRYWPITQLKSADAVLLMASMRRGQCLHHVNEMFDDLPQPCDLTPSVEAGLEIVRRGDGAGTTLGTSLTGDTACGHHKSCWQSRDHSV